MHPSTRGKEAIWNSLLLVETESSNMGISTYWGLKPAIASDTFFTVREALLTEMPIKSAQELKCPPVA